jgi:hypothetical protein
VTTRNQAVDRIAELQQPTPPKKRRTAQEQALDPLMKLRAKVAARLVAAQEAATEVAAELLKLDKMIDVIRGESDDAPESE